VSSPQHDWCQGTLVLTPGVPRLLTLEVSYLLPVPAWFLHPAALDDVTGRLALDLSCGFGSYVTDPRFSDGGGGGAAAAPAGAGVERLELCGQLAWRPSRVASFFNRLLSSKGPASCKGGGARQLSPRPGAGGAYGGGGGGGGVGVGVPGCVGVSYSRGGGGGGGGGGDRDRGGAPGGAAAAPPPASSTHLLGVSKVAAWQVPSDNEWRFAEGFLFSAEDHKAEQLLGRYRLLAPPAPAASAAGGAGT
jgi:hypothetical protein